MKKKVGEVLTDTELDEYDWYWGPASTHNTNQGLLEGCLNTEILAADDISSATPKTTTARGRKSKDYTGDDPNTRRDLSTNLRNTANNGYSDWFVPSKAELLRIFSYLVSGSTIERNFAEDTNYWSSSENSGTTAYAIDFNFDSDPGAEVISERSEVSHVRPARAF